MSKKILIVDDEDEFGSTLAERLLIRDYDAKAVYDVEKAMIEIRQSPPDIVLLDLRMPGGFGMSTIKAIKEISPKTKILMITGHGSQQNVKDALENGAEGFMIKPINIEELLDKIETLYNQSQAINP